MVKEKIAFLDYSYIFSGAEASLHTLLKYLDRSKFESIIIFPFPMSHQRRYGNLGIEIICLSDKIKWWMGSDRWKKPIRGSDFIKRFVLSFKMVRVLINRDIRILHINLMRPDAFWWVLLPRIFGVKIVAHVRSDFADWMPSPNLQKLCNSIICVSEYVKCMVTKKYKHFSIYVVYDTVLAGTITDVISKNEAKKRLGYTSELKLISSVGLLSQHKGHDMAIKVFSGIREYCNNCFLLIAGGGSKDELNRLKILAENSGISEFVGFTENQIQEISLVYLASEFVFSLSRHGEAFGRVPFEAASLGTPCIAPDCGAITEILEDGVSGFMVNPLVEDQIIQKALFILSGTEKVNEIRIKSRQAVLEKLSPNLTVQRIESIYSDLLKVV